MNTESMSLFDENPLKGIRICLAGKFAMPSINLNKRLRQLGVIEPIDHVVSASTDEMNSKPVKEGTCLFVVGTDAPEDCLRRYDLNCHDGFNAVRITEEELYSLMRGEKTMDIPKTIKKHINLDYSYFEWMSPKGQTTRKDSPYLFNLDSVMSPVYEREIFVPDFDGVNMSALRQIIGNLGGYANTYFDDRTDMVFLSDSTIEKLKNGIQDDIIQKIEKSYNSSDNKIFNIQFCSETHFMEWVKVRLSKCPDPSTQALVDRLYQPIV